MKKFVKSTKFAYLFTTVMVILCLCRFRYTPVENDHFINYRLKVSEIKFNGHYYVVTYRTDDSGGVCIIHSPNCTCARHY